MLLYLTQEENIRVAIEINRKYSLLKPRTRTGSPTGAIVQTLITRFKEFNRRKNDHISATPKLPNMKKSRSTQHMMKKWFVELPHIPIGEDTVSFECQNVKIKSEWKKSKRN